LAVLRSRPGSRTRQYGNVAGCDGAVADLLDKPERWERNLGKTNLPTITDVGTLLEVATRQRWPASESHLSESSYRLALGRETIELGIIEFRILLFLASRPYHAFTLRSIAAAVRSEERPVAEDSVEQYVANLLDQLGPFHNYVQAVPFIGYRFKP
jgi:DNA-binding response OmpR family regulator